MEAINVHAHIIPSVFIEKVQEGKIDGVSIIENSNGKKILSFRPDKNHPMTELFFDEQVQLLFMDEKGISKQAISVPPRLFFFDRPIDYDGDNLSRVFNNEIIERCQRHLDRFFPVGNLPMLNTDLALKEIEYLISRGVRMVQIGTTISDVNLDDPRFEPIWEVLEKGNTSIIIHPLIVNSDPKTKRYHLSNAVGNPYQTSAATGNLIMSGVLDRYPNLQFILVHGGGFVPYQIGRLDHVFECRPTSEHTCLNKPSSYLKKNFYVDGLTHSKDALEYLIKIMGVERVLFGTDYPYDMADYKQPEWLKELLSAEDAEAILKNNAIRLLK